MNTTPVPVFIFVLIMVFSFSTCANNQTFNSAFIRSDKKFQSHFSARFKVVFTLILSYHPNILFSVHFVCIKSHIVLFNYYK